MRADRLLSILLLLQVHRRMTAGEMARQLEVSERTIQRDMEALSMAGVPVVAERGAGGGWSLPDGYQTNLTGLNQTEIQTLFLAQPAAVLADLGLSPAIEAARIKLQAALPPRLRSDAEFIRQRILVDTAGWHGPGERSDLLPTVQDAVFQQCMLAMTYRRSDGTVTDRSVAPVGLVAKGNAWYLVAAAEGEVRTFRIDRMLDARVLDEPAPRPDGFDLAAYWQQSKESFVANLPRYPVTLRCAPAVLHRVRAGGRFSRVERVDPPADDGWSTVAIRFELPEDACAFALGFGPQVAVLEPSELRAKVLEQARAMVAFYESGERKT